MDLFLYDYGLRHDRVKLFLRKHDFLANNDILKRLMKGLLLVILKHQRVSNSRDL